MQFAALPPEINSGLMYTGPGSGPLLAAAAAWDGLSAELHSAATAYDSVVAGLTRGVWLGPSSAVMAAAAAPYAAWLVTTAGLAEQTATQTRAAAAAYETAFAMTVAPPVITANRAQLVALVATNVLGQNTTAIAANEAHYAQMWAQDATAMYGYAGSAATAVDLTPFPAPPRVVAGVGQPGRAAAVAHAVGAGATAGTAEALPAQTPALTSLFTPVIQLIALSLSSTTASLNPSLSGASWNAAANNSRMLLGNTNQILENHEVLLDAADEIRRVEAKILGRLSSASSTGQLPSAGLARAISIGKLSAPLNWAVAAPEVRTVAYTLPAAGAAAVPLTESPVAAFSQMALAGMAGSALAGTVSRGHGEYVAARSGERVPATADEPVEAPPPDGPMTEIVIGIRQISELRDAGLLTAREFDEQKQRLLQLPLRSAPQ